jgi:hypothetical protein
MSENKDLVNLNLENCSLDTVSKVIKDIEDSYFDIPFGNTGYQTKAFVIAAGITPERSYRAIGLQMITLLNSIRYSLIEKQISDIRLTQKKESLNDPSLNSYDREVIRLEIMRDFSSDNYQRKVLSDSLHELNILYEEFKKLPKFTREQFELGEENYFKQSLERQARGITGAVEGIINMNEDMPALEKYKDKVNSLESIDTSTLNSLRLGMGNQMKIFEEDDQSRREHAQLQRTN